MSLISKETNRLISHVPGGGAPTGIHHDVARKGIENAGRALSHSKPLINSARHEGSKAADSFVSSVKHAVNKFTRDIIASIPQPRIP